MMQPTDVGNAPHHIEHVHEPMPSPRELTAIVRRIYRTGPRLSWHQSLTTVYRPYYVPFGLLLRWIPLGATVLDLGCGTGAFLHLTHFLKPLAKGYGVDPRAEQLSLGQAVSRDPRLTFLQRQEVPVEIIRACSVIVLIDILHHIPTAARLSILQRLIDNAARGTVFIVKDLDARPRWRALANRITDFLSTRSRVHYMTMTEVTAFCRENAMDVLHARRYHKYIWSHYLVVARR